MSTYAERVLAALTKLDRNEIISSPHVEPFSDELDTNDDEIEVLPYDSYDYKKSFGRLQGAVMVNFVDVLYDGGKSNVADVLKLKSLLFSDPSNPSTEARLFAALHLLKKHLPDSRGWDDLLSIKIVHSGEVAGVGLSQLKAWAVSLIYHPRAWKILTEVVRTTHPDPKPPIEITPTNLEPKVHFFTSDNTSLWAFSGIGTIFLNLSAFSKAYDDCQARANFDELLFPNTLKLLVAAVGYHVIVHLAVWKAANDANAFEVSEEMDRNYGHFYLCEPGLVAQIRFFGLGGIPDLARLNAETTKVFCEYVENRTTRKKMADVLEPPPPVIRPSVYQYIYQIPKMASGTDKVHH